MILINSIEFMNACDAFEIRIPHMVDDKVFADFKNSEYRQMLYDAFAYVDTLTVIRGRNDLHGHVKNAVAIMLSHDDRDADDDYVERLTAIVSLTMVESYCDVIGGIDPLMKTVDDFALESKYQACVVEIADQDRYTE